MEILFANGASFLVTSPGLASQSCITNGTFIDEKYYTLLLGLDGEAALGNVQNAYKLYDEDGNLLNECGEIEEAAYRYFMEK